MMVEQIAIKNDYEWEALELLKKQSFNHTKRFDTRFLIKTELKQDVNQIFTIVGWKDFGDVVEPGSQLLTMEFLISLAIEEIGTKTKIYFRLFNEQFVMKLKEFSSRWVFMNDVSLTPASLLRNTVMTEIHGGVQSQMNL